MTRRAASRLLLATAVAAATALAGVSSGAAVAGSPGPALRAGEWSLSPAALAFLRAVAARRTPDVSLETVAEAALADHVMGAHAARTVGDEALFDDWRVALRVDAGAVLALDASIAAAWREPLARALGEDRGAHLVTKRHPLTTATLKAALADTRAVRLDDRLPAAKLAALARVPVLDWRIDEATAGRVTLQDLWPLLNLQDRHALSQGDVRLAFTRAEDRVQAAFARRWVVREGKLSVADLDTLQALLADHERRAALARWMGALDDGSFHSAELDRLRAAVSADDVAAFWRAHPDRFTRIERVRARHVHCADEARCRDAQAAIVAGEDFAVVARRASDAADAARGGELGWLTADASRGDWLTQVAFAVPPGAPIAPVHAPPRVDGRDGGWEVVQVQERVTGVHPVDSETVRYTAGQALARERAADNFEALRHQLVAEAGVEADAALGLDAAALRGAAPASASASH